LVQAHNITKSFQAQVVLRGVDLSVEKGDVVAILGPSGSGKTTLLRCLNFLETADGGTLEFDGETFQMGQVSKKYIARLRKKTAFVFQSYNLVPVLNVYENIVLPIELDGTRIDTPHIESIMETLGLTGKVNSLPNQLSGGQQQRVAIARALASKPAIILADEPTGNLDSKTSLDVMGLLKVTCERFSQTMVMITHNEEIAQMADRIIRIEDGKIVGGNND